MALRWISELTHDEGEIALSPPAQNKTLRLLALGQGTFNYSCENAQPANAPVYVEQFTQLYDATPLIPLGESDDYLRMLVEELYQFDYTLLRNGTIDCIGTIGTLNSTAVVTLFEIDTFEPYLEESVEAPVNRMYDGAWAHARTLNNEWEMYRVQMVGGVVPPTCQDMNSTFDIRYAAEYWFYHEG